MKDNTLANELGTTARSTYVEIVDNEIMPHLLDGGGGGAAADESIQTTLDNLSKKKRVLSNEHRRKISESLKGKIVSEETRQKISEALKGEKSPMYGTTLSDETKRKISKMKRGENHHQFGKPRSEKTKRKLSEANKGKKLSKEHRQKISVAGMGHDVSEERRRKISEALKGRKLSEEHKAKMRGRTCSEETRAKLSASQSDYMSNPEARAKISAALKGKFTGENNSMFGRTGENHPNWQGGKSFEPYCPKFNESLKESIRNRDNRTCVLCGKSEIRNGRRLSVHHIDSDKMQGCRGKRWYLCALCRSCNSKTDTVEKEFLIVSNLSPVRGRSGA